MLQEFGPTQAYFASYHLPSIAGGSCCPAVSHTFSRVWRLSRQGSVPNTAKCSNPFDAITGSAVSRCRGIQRMLSCTLLTAVCASDPVTTVSYSYLVCPCCQITLGGRMRGSCSRVQTTCTAAMACPLKKPALGVVQNPCSRYVIHLGRGRGTKGDIPCCTSP